MSSEARRFALLDRDGTINREVDHLSDPDELALLPGSAAAIRKLREDLGLGVVVVTNQANVGRGVLSTVQLDAIHDRLRSMLAAEGAAVDAILVCPHAPEDDCACRKPRPGMAMEAAERFGFDPAEAFVVGDHAGDVGMGRAIGATTFLVMTGHGPAEVERAREDADHVVPDLAAAVDIIAGLVTGERTTPPISRGHHVSDEGFRRAADAYLREAASTMEATLDRCLDDVVAAADILTASFRGGGTLLICGNGGSAADAQHLATEFVSTFTIDNPRPSIPAIALTTDSSLLTAIANDFGVEGMFARQVESHGQAGDVLMGISTSGNSRNVIRAAEQAHAQELQVIALTGETGGDLAPAADVAIRVPSTVTAHIQECHLAIEQLLASLVEDALYPRA